MTGSQIITAFERQVDDLTELSTSEELAVLNRVYREILGKKDWKFLHTIGTGTISGTDLTLPADFDELVPNNNYAGTSEYNNGSYVFVGANRVPYRVIDISERNKYRNANNYCYLDLKNNKIVFMSAPSETSAEFDYKYVPDDIEAGTSPVIPARFHEIFSYAMAVEDTIIQQSPKAKSYARENQAKYEEWYRILSNWDLKQL